MINLWAGKNVLFVVRGRNNLLFESICERDLPEHTSQEILIDQEVLLTGVQTKAKYPKKISRIAFFHPNGYVIELLTNDFKHAAGTIAELYRFRWKIETFFLNLKQNLHIKSFLGTFSECSRDTDPDCSNYNTPTSSPQTSSETPMASIKLNGIAQTKHFH